MITSFEVRNYKSIRSLILPMRRFMVFVGPNGAGKTNLVAALQLFGDILYRGTTDPVRDIGWDQVIRREKKPARSGLTFRVEVELPSRILRRSMRGSADEPLSHSGLPSVTAEATLTVGGSVDSDQVSVRSEVLSIRAGNRHAFQVRFDPSSGVNVELGEDPHLVEFLVPRPFLEDASGLRQTKLPFDAPRAKAAVGQWFSMGEAADSEPTLLHVLNWLRTPWMRYLADACHVDRVRLDASALRSDSPHKDSGGAPLGGAGEGLAWAVDRLKSRASTRFQRVLSALQQVYPRIEDIRPHRVQPGRLALYFKEKGISEELGPSNVSDGVLHALALLLMLEGERPSGGVLAIEEPENAIHPWSVRAMIGRAQDNPPRQVLITTHSDSVVSAVRDPNDLFIVDIDGDNGTTVAPAPDRERAISAILRDTGQRLGDVWMGGSLGGVPGGQ